jgi:beta-galactosidase GanA
VAAAYQSAPSEAARRFYEALAAWAGVKNPLNVDGGAEARWLETGSGRLLFLFNHDRQARDVKWSLEGVSGALDLATGEPAPAQFTLSPLGVRVLLLR